MADEDTDQSTPEQRTEAAGHGWVDRPDFKGPAEKWVDAKTFMERAETFIPFLQKQKRETGAALEAERQARIKLEGELTASRKAIETLNKLNEEDRAAAVESAKKEVKAQIAEAVKSGDTEVLGELTEQLIKLTTPLAKVEANDAEDQDDPNAGDSRGNGSPKLHPDFEGWVKQNPWYGTDPYKSDLAIAEARRLRRGGDQSTGMEFFDKVSVGVDKIIRPQGGRSKVEAGNLGAGGGDLTGGSGYDSLPAEAKAECSKEAKKRVGPNKPYKTVTEWNKRFADLYWAQPGVTKQ